MLHKDRFLPTRKKLPYPPIFKGRYGSFLFSVVIYKRYVYFSFSSWSISTNFWARASPMPGA